MTTHTDRRIIGFSPEQMYGLVADIERYPEFLPWCRRLKIRSRRTEGNRTKLTADMTISFKIVSESFVSTVILDPELLRIDVAYVDGPFRHLTNRWRFEARPGGGSVIDFYIDFEFKNRALQLLIGAVFHTAVTRLVVAFEARAHQLFGSRLPSSEPKLAQ